MPKNTARRTFDSPAVGAAEKADSRDAAKPVYITGRKAS
jgi:hypothetical protein